MNKQEELTKAETLPGIIHRQNQKLLSMKKELQDKEKEILELKREIEGLRVLVLERDEEELQEKDKLIETLKVEMAKLEEDFARLRLEKGKFWTDEQVEKRIENTLLEKQKIQRKLDWAEGTIDVIKSALRRGAFI